MIGTTLKHYEVESLIGKGGMGEVYRARDVRLGRVVALKILPTEFTADAARRSRFLQEARAASAVNHPSIAQVYDVDEADGKVFLAMELVEGRTLRSLIQNRELDVLGALEIAQQVAGGLAKAHEAGIVHRDIKPENIVVAPEGHAKILDFGLAKLREPPSGGGPDDLSHMETLARTQSGMILGTLRYMSPEQARGHEVDPRSDIFSLGIVLYEMVTGQLPFSGATAIDTLHAIAFEETRPVTALRANIAPSVQRIVSRCLRKQAKDRYPSARELIVDLRLAEKEVESGATSAPPLANRLQGWWNELFGSSPSGTSGPTWQQVAIPIAGMVFVLLVILITRGRDIWPTLVPLALVGIFVYRRIRNRRYYMLKDLRSRLRKMPDVRLAVADGQRLTLVTENALANTYVRSHAIVNDFNRKMLYGDAFTLVIRDNPAEEDVRGLLASPSIVYLRDDSKAERRNRSRR